MPRGREVSAREAAKAARDASKLLDRTEREDFFAAVVAGAVEYRCSKFLGRGRYDVRSAASIEEAAKHSLAMGVEGVMIYAVNKAGRSVLINAGGKAVKA